MQDYQKKLIADIVRRNFGEQVAQYSDERLAKVWSFWNAYCRDEDPHFRSQAVLEDALEETKDKPA